METSPPFYGGQLVYKSIYEATQGLSKKNQEKREWAGARSLEYEKRKAKEVGETAVKYWPRIDILGKIESRNKGKGYGSNLIRVRMSPCTSPRIVMVRQREGNRPECFGRT